MILIGVCLNHDLKDLKEKKDFGGCLNCDFDWSLSEP